MTNWRFLSLIAGFALVTVLAVNDVLVYTPDSARYLLWAKSLTQLEGFEDLSIAEPFHYVVHAPLYSVLLVPSALIAPDSVVLAKSLTALFGVGLLLLLFLWLRRLVGDPVALLGTGILAFHPLTILYSNQILSDIPFAATLVLVFVLVDRMDSMAQADSRSLWVLSIVLTAALFLREVGTTLLFAVVVYFLAKKDFRKAFLVSVIPILCYLAWFVRNEIIVAGAEHPPLRNSEIFTLHYFTDRSAPLIEELFARFHVNLPVYVDHVSRIVFLSQYGTSSYGVLITTEPPVSSVASVVPTFHLVLALLTFGLAVYGAVVALKRNPSTGLFLAFVPIYLLLILFYPFNDVRFVYPLLIFMVGYGLLGAWEGIDQLRRKFPKATGPAAAAFLGIVLIPNFAWCFAFVRDNMAYRKSPEDFYASVAEMRPFPDMLTKPMSRAGEWITARHPGSVIVMTQWKELAFWLPDGKLVELNTLVPLDEFERFIRDYRVSYVVSAVGLAGIPEFYSQMLLSRRYDFESVFRVANLEVFRIKDEGPALESEVGDEAGDGPVWEADLRLRHRFRTALELLDGGGADSSRKILEEILRSTRGGSILTLHLAIAYEFEGWFGPAKELLSSLQVMRQSGPFLGHAKFHQEIIDLLERAGAEQNPHSRAELLYIASAKYWNLGFRYRSLNLLDYSLEADPRFGPALIFGIYYNLELGRDKEAREYFLRLKEAVPGHPLIDQFSTILGYRDSVMIWRTFDPRSYLEPARAYREAGLGDSAIDELLELLQRDPVNAEALRMLADLYASKRRYEPALQAIERLLDALPTDTAAREFRRELLDRW